MIGVPSSGSTRRNSAVTDSAWKGRRGKLCDAGAKAEDSRPREPNTDPPRLRHGSLSAGHGRLAAVRRQPCRWLRTEILCWESLARRAHFVEMGAFRLHEAGRTRGVGGAARAPQARRRPGGDGGAAQSLAKRRLIRYNGTRQAAPRVLRRGHSAGKGSEAPCAPLRASPCGDRSGERRACASEFREHTDKAEA